MLFARHLRRLIGDTLAYAVVTRRLSLLVAVVIGLCLVAIGLAAQSAAPFVLYPFV